jgi:hypothetical protein
MKRILRAAPKHPRSPSLQRVRAFPQLPRAPHQPFARRRSGEARVVLYLNHPLLECPVEFLLSDNPRTRDTKMDDRFTDGKNRDKPCVLLERSLLRHDSEPSTSGLRNFALVVPKPGSLECWRLTLP